MHVKIIVAVLLGSLVLVLAGCASTDGNYSGRSTSSGSGHSH